MPVILFNAKPLIQFAYLGFLPAWISMILYVIIMRLWYKVLKRYQNGHSKKDLLLLIIGPLLIIGSYIQLSILVGWHMYLTGVVTFIIMILCCVVIPAFTEYQNKYPKQSSKMIRTIKDNLRHPVHFINEK